MAQANRHRADASIRQQQSGNAGTVFEAGLAHPRSVAGGAFMPDAFRRAQDRLGCDETGIPFLFFEEKRRWTPAFAGVTER
jgi:hypothetical protein